MRAIWKGAVSFGLVNVPVRLFAATEEHDIRFHQVHRDDGGRIRYKRTCDVCGEEVGYADIAKGYESGDGQLVTLTDADLENLPIATGREIDVVEFVPNDQVDPILFAKSYYLEPEARAAKPYALLREALLQTDRMAVVKVALRQKETLAVLRVRDRAIVLQTMLWPDEIRAADFDVLRNDIELRPQEMQMASSLIQSMTADFKPDEFVDDYQTAMAELIELKLTNGDTRQVSPEDTGTGTAQGGDVIDLLTALQRSVDQARGKKPVAPADVTQPEDDATASGKPTKAATKKAVAHDGAAKKAVGGRAPVKKAAAEGSSGADDASGARSARKSPPPQPAKAPAPTKRAPRKQTA